ncbi:hypothetical protein [Streptomyces sp. NPDC005143]
MARAGNPWEHGRGPTIVLTLGTGTGTGIEVFVDGVLLPNTALVLQPHLP